MSVRCVTCKKAAEINQLLRRMQGMGADPACYLSPPDGTCIHRNTEALSCIPRKEATKPAR